MSRKVIESSDLPFVVPQQSRLPVIKDAGSLVAVQSQLDCEPSEQGPSASVGCFCNSLSAVGTQLAPNK